MFAAYEPSFPAIAMDVMMCEDGDSMVTIPWDLAEFTDEFSRLGKTISSGTLSVPKQVSLSGGILKWQPGGMKNVAPGDGFFNKFVRLWEGDPSDYLSYAKTWGVLFLDQSGRPCVAIGPIERQEPLTVWTHFSRRACAVINIAAALKAKEPAAETEWAALGSMIPFTGDFVAELDRFGPEFALGLIAKRGLDTTETIAHLSRDLKAAKSMLNIEVMNWLRLGRVSLTLVPRDSGWAIETDFNQCLLGAIALQLAMTLAGADSLYVCSSCTHAYTRDRDQRAPKPGQANFCHRCGRGAALHQADQKRREKVREVKRLRDEGMTPKQIDTAMSLAPGQASKLLTR